MAKESNLIAAFVPVFPLAATMAIAVSPITALLLYIVIDIGSLYHLRKVQRHPVKYDSRLSVRIDVFVIVSSNGCDTRHQLSEHENKEHQDEYRDE